MAATVIIRRITGATGSQTPTDLAGGNTRANAFDTHTTADTTNPVQKPGAGVTKYSFWVNTRLDATTTPAGTIDNIRWFADGANNFASGIAAIGNTATSYKQAVGTDGDTGTELTVGNYSTLAGAPVDVFTHTSGSPKTVAGSISNPSTGQFGDLFVYQLTVTTDAGPGESGTETYTYRFDET